MYDVLTLWNEIASAQFLRHVAHFGFMLTANLK